MQTDIQCLGFIMDGNRRWARERGLPTVEGHRKAGDVLADSIRFVRSAGIPHAVYYAFSTENWNRSEEEVTYLMDLFRDWLVRIDKEINSGQEEPVRVKVIGRRGDFPSDIQKQMTELEEKSWQRKEAKTTIWLALSYGGHAEIVEVVNRAVEAGEPMTEEKFEKMLWTADLPDPDMIVRTSGEQRLSNFLTWKSTYSELYFIDKHWPALTKTDFEDILNEYAKRERRNGK